MSRILSQSLGIEPNRDRKCAEIFCFPTLEGWLFFDYSLLKVILRGFFIRNKTTLLESLLPRLIKKIAHPSNVGAFITVPCFGFLVERTTPHNKNRQHLKQSTTFPHQEIKHLLTTKKAIPLHGGWTIPSAFELFL